MLKQLLSQFAKEYWGGEDQLAHENGLYHLTFEGDLVLSIKELPNNGIGFTGIIGSLPDSKKEEYLLRTMEANLFGKETGDNVLALTIDGKQAILTRLLPTDIKYPFFRNAIEDFLNYLESWKIDTFAFAEESNK